MTSKIVTEPTVKELKTRGVCTCVSVGHKPDCVVGLKHRVESAEQTVEKLRQGIQAYLDGDYDNPASHRYDNLSLNKYSGCEHGEPYYKECTICDDAYFSKLLEDSA